MDNRIDIFIIDELKLIDGVNRNILKDHLSDSFNSLSKLMFNLSSMERLLGGEDRGKYYDILCSQLVFLERDMLVLKKAIEIVERG